MCGIVGYIGNRQAQEILLDGLARLEYRGYDSAGIAVMENATIQLSKAKGRLKNLVARSLLKIKEVVSRIEEVVEGEGIFKGRICGGNGVCKNSAVFVL